MVGSGKDDNIATHLANASVLAPDQLAIVSARSGFFEPRSFKELYREGQYILNHDLLESNKGTIVNLDSISPAAYFAGVPIYKTRENIYLSVNNIL